jgi:hypothetical protein
LFAASVDLWNVLISDSFISQRRCEMQNLLGVALLTTFILSFAAAASPASARDYRYCLQGRQWGYPGNCQFSTYRQCMATASGTDSYCGINPRVAFRERGYYR